MTKAELVNELALTTGIDKKAVSVVLEAFTASVKQHVIEGENIYIRGFGSFVSRVRAAKMARNISKQTTVSVPAHRIPAFKPAAEFRANIRK